MTQPNFDLAPRAEFADRLERDLLRVVGDTTALTDQNRPEEDLMTIELDRPVAPPHRRSPLTFVATTAAMILLAIGVWLFARTSDEATPAAGTPVSFTVAWEHTEKDRTCAEGNAQTCLTLFSLPASSTFAGDVAGIASQVVLWNTGGPVEGQQRSHVDHAAVYGFNGTVAPCGVDAGQFMVVETIRWVSGEGFDGNTGTYTGTWQIVDDSGRNGLKHISGSGESHSVMGNDARTFTGTINCSAG